MRQHAFKNHRNVQESRIIFPISNWSLRKWEDRFRAHALKRLARHSHAWVAASICDRPSTQLTIEMVQVRRGSDVVSAVLEKPTELDAVRSRVIDDAVTRVSLNHADPNLPSIMHWCGAHMHPGRGSIIKAFVDVGCHRDSIGCDLRLCLDRANRPPWSNALHPVRGSRPGW